MLSFKGETLAERETAHASAISALEVNSEEACAITVCEEGKIIIWNISRVKSKLVLKPIKEIDFLDLGSAKPKFASSAALLFGATRSDQLFALNYLNAKVFCFTSTAFSGKVKGLELFDSPFTFFACWTEDNEFACVAPDGTVLSQVTLAHAIQNVVFWQTEAGFYKAGFSWQGSRQLAVFSLPFFKFKRRIEVPFEIAKAVWSPKTKHLYLLGESELEVILEGSLEAV